MEPYKIIDLQKSGFGGEKTFALDVLHGLSGHPKTLSSKYLYDELGSYIFTKITDLEEYYPTLCELETLDRYKAGIHEIAKSNPFRLIELGVGDARKTKVLLKYFLEQELEFEYILLDCCKEVVEQTLASLKNQYKDTSLKAYGLVGDYADGLDFLNDNQAIKNIVLFLGSSIGNFNRDHICHFLRSLWNVLKHEDYAFIGFDLKKQIPILQKAYDDSEGVTREFNLNLLDRVNRELDADFDRTQFSHHCFYNPLEGRMESWLISQKKQKVAIRKLGKVVEFQSHEGIHVENSHKYSLDEIECLAKTLGFSPVKSLLDSKEYYSNVLWRVEKSA